MICYINTSTDPAFNLAFEENILHQEIDDSILILWQNANTIVIGRNQNVFEEIDIEKAEENDVKIVRRNTGGGAVYQDLGNLNFSIIQNKDKPGTYQVMLQPLIDVLQSLNINAQFTGKNDIKVDNQKISGNAQYIYKNRLLHHGTILFDVDLSKIINYLHIDPLKIKSKGIKSRRAMVTNIKKLLPESKRDMTINDFRKLLIDRFQKNNIEIKEISSDYIRQAQMLSKQKYRTWDWNFGQFPCSELKNSKYFPAKGKVEVFATLKNSKFEQIKFFGDFNGGPVPLNLFESKILNCRYQKQALSKIITDDLVASVFGELFTAADIIDLILNLKNTE